MVYNHFTCKCFVNITCTSSLKKFSRGIVFSLTNLALVKTTKDDELQVSCTILNRVHSAALMHPIF